MNLKQVARALDVHYMTAYRYVRHGRLPAWREGSVWMVDPADVEDLRRTPVGTATTGSPRVDWSARLAAALAAGDEVLGWSIVRDALASGRDAPTVHVDVLLGALALVGAQVADGQREPFVGRVATTTAARLVARLGGLAVRPGRSRGSVVVAAPPGEHHALPLAIVANLVRCAGGRPVDLGTDVGGSDLVAAARACPDLAAIAIGASTNEAVEGARSMIAEARRELRDVPVLVGGHAVGNPEVARLPGATCWSTGADLMETLVGLIGARRPVDQVVGGVPSVGPSS